MKAALASVLKVMVLYIPKTIWYAAPIAFLFSITYILSDLYSSNEMEALFASGISLLRFVFPVFIFAIIGSIGMFFWEDKLVVDTLKQKKILQNELLGTTQSNNNSNVVVQSSNGNLIYKVQKYYDSEKLIENCTFIFRDDDKNLLAIITADSGIWDEEQIQTVKMAHRYHCMDNSRYAAYASADCNFLWPRSVFRDKYLVNF